MAMVGLQAADKHGGSHAKLTKTTRCVMLTCAHHVCVNILATCQIIPLTTENVPTIDDQTTFNHLSSI
jgi:hypothetical protein